jgi:hypothetical protein
MGIFNALKVLVSPKHAEFTKRLIAKRIQLSDSRLLAGLAVLGSPMCSLRQSGLGATEYAVAPEATIVRVLEKYWETYSFSHFFYSEVGLSNYISAEEKAKKAAEGFQGHLGRIEYLLTKRPDAAMHVPLGLSLVGYIKYRIAVEHTHDPYASGCGITDELIEYAIAESEFVFRR